MYARTSIAVEQLVADRRAEYETIATRGRLRRMIARSKAVDETRTATVARLVRPSADIDLRDTDPRDGTRIDSVA